MVNTVKCYREIKREEDKTRLLDTAIERSLVIFPRAVIFIAHSYLSNYCNLKTLFSNLTATLVILFILR